MRLTLEDEPSSSEDGGYTPGRPDGRAEHEQQQIVRLNTASKARLQAIKDRVASHTPYTATRSRRRGVDGVQATGGRQNGAENDDQAAFSLPQVFHSPPSFASKLLSVATTPLRAAWGIVASQLRTPSASPLDGAGVGMAGGDTAAANGGDANGHLADGNNDDNNDNNDSVMAQDRAFGASPPSPARTVNRDGESQSPNKRRAATGGVATRRRTSPRKGAADVARTGTNAIGATNATNATDAGHQNTRTTPRPVKKNERDVPTPFDGVLDMLKEGPMAGGTPARHPPPSKSAMKSIPQSMRAPRSAQPAFTFDATKQRLLSSVPAKPVGGVVGAGAGGQGAHAREGTPAQTKKRMMFGSQGGSATKGMPLAWTPLRATPLAARSAGGARTRFAPSSRFAPASQGAGAANAAMESRKRRVDDVHGPSQTLDDGSVSLLDMQRRRRFKPSEDPGSVQRRSWRAGRTPYSHMARYKRRIDDDEAVTDPSRAHAGATPAAKGPVPLPSPLKSTTDTARRILETLDSMEEKIRKSKEHVSPVDARMYTLDAAAAPPPGASLGGVMLSSKMTPVTTAAAGAAGATPSPSIAFTPISTTTAKSTAPVPMATPISGVPKPFLSVQEATTAPALEPFGKPTSADSGSWKAMEATKQAFGVSPSSDRPSGGKKKRSRVVGDADANSDGGANKASEPSTKKTFALTPAVDKPVAVPGAAPSFLAPPAAAAPPAVAAPVVPVSQDPSTPQFVFGRKTDSVKDSVDKALQGIVPAQDATKFAFGEEKCAGDKPVAAPASSVPASSQPASSQPASSQPASSQPTPLFSFGAAAKKDDEPTKKDDEPTKKDDEPTKKADASEQAPKPAPVQSGWGSDFLKQNSAAATAAAEAAAEEASGAAAAPPPASAPSAAPAFTFGASSSNPALVAVEPVTKPAFSFGASPPAPVAAPAFSFGAAGQEDKASDKEASKSEDATATHGFKFGAPPATETATDGVGAPKPAFTFGAPSAPAAEAATAVAPSPAPAAAPAATFGTAAEKKQETTTTTATPGWGADFLAKNAQQGAAATAAVEKEVNKDPSTDAAPAIKFGVPSTATEKPIDKPAASDAPSVAPAFKFGSSSATDAPVTKPAFQFGSATPATTAPSATAAVPSAPSFSFGAPAPAKTDAPKAAPLGAPAFGAPAEKKDPAPSAPASAGFVFGASSTPATKPAEAAGGFGSSFGAAAGPSFGSQPAAPAFGASSGAAFGSAPATGSPAAALGGSTMGAQNPPASGFAFGSQPAAPANPFGASTGGFGAPAATGGFGAPASTNAFGAPAPASGGFGAPAGGGFGSSAPFGGTSSTAAFGAPLPQATATATANPFGQPPGQFGAPAPNPGFPSSSFGAPNAFPPSSAPGQMIPNNPDNPFGGGTAAGGFNLGSSGTGTQSRSEGRRKVRVRRKQ